MELIECPFCQSLHAQVMSECPACNCGPAILDGFLALSPEALDSVASAEFFNPEDFKRLFSQESSNFWFNARNNAILWAIERYAKIPENFLEIGCGTGFVLNFLESSFPATEIYGTELFIAGLKISRERCQRAHLLQLDARKMPFIAHFDIVGIFDVLEHIDADERVLHGAWKALKNEGFLIITVPQHKWLWSKVDVAACHVRRYSAKELEGKVVAAGFEVIKSTSFVSLLLPAMLLSRSLMRKSKAGREVELEISRPLNMIFSLVMAIELKILRLGFNLRAGGSRLIVARKKRNDPL